MPNLSFHCDGFGFVVRDLFLIFRFVSLARDLFLLKQVVFDLTTLFLI